MVSLRFVYWISFLALYLSLISAHQFTLNGTVLELTDSNFDSAISNFEFILVDFYAPWCGHCQRLSPELDSAAPFLAKLTQPIVVAKLDADKYSRLAEKLEITGYPTLKFYDHGVPMLYYGPRTADLMVDYLKKFVAPDISVLKLDSSVKEYVEAAGSAFPVFIGFGLNQSMISIYGAKYKKKAWFAVANDVSKNLMKSYGFSTVPALVVKYPRFDEQNVFYGPFVDEFLETFVKQNLLPLTLPMNYETLMQLQEDKRKIVLAIVENVAYESSGKLILAMRAAAPKNRDLVFVYVGVKQFEEFANWFRADNHIRLPKVVVWDGNEEYDQVIGLETMNEKEDQMTQVSRFLEGYREGRTEKKRINRVSSINNLISINTMCIVVFLVAVIIGLRRLYRKKLARVRTGSVSVVGEVDQKSK